MSGGIAPWPTTTDSTERLASRTVGDAGPRVVFVHGLFGQGKNWTTIAKGLADRHRVTLLDLPNHGHSPWTDRVDYLDMAELLAAELRELGEPVTLVGHSMGGKVAMQLALRRPELLRALVVVDVAPSDYPERGARTDDPDEEATPFAGYIAAMRALDLDSLRDQGRRRRGAAQPPSPAGWSARSCCRAWCGTAPTGWRWRLNLAALARDLGRPARLPGAAAGRHVRRAGALDRRGELDLRAAGGPRAHGRAVPVDPAGEDQERRPLGAQRAARGLRRDDAEVPGRRRE